MFFFPLLKLSFLTILLLFFFPKIISPLFSTHRQIYWLYRWVSYAYFFSQNNLCLRVKTKCKSTSTLFHYIMWFLKMILKMKIINFVFFFHFHISHSSIESMVLTCEYSRTKAAEFHLQATKQNFNSILFSVV